MWKPLLVLASLVAAASCRTQNPVGLQGPTGTIKGFVTTSDGVTPIGLATVSLLNGSAVTIADSQGAYTLSAIPEGARQLLARRGNFEATTQVTVVASQTVTAPPLELVPTGKLAYVSGTFDSIQTLAHDQWGLSMEELSAPQLGNASVLNQYRMIFLNCGLDTGPAADPSVISVLLAWIRAGGTLYTSDFAVPYAQALHPQDILSTERSGAQTVAATIIDTDLQVFAFATAAEITYGHSDWYGLVSTPPQLRVLLRGNYLSGGTQVLNRPLAVVIPDGAGKLLYTTFHNTAGVKADQITALKFLVYLQ